MPVPKGCDSDLTLRQVLHADAFKVLRGGAKSLTLGDTWRMNGWARRGDKPVNEDPVLSKLDMDEILSISEALEVHLRKHGNSKGWRYVNPTYACGACCACCAVAVQPSAHR
jgi:hypothetical protein